MESAYYPWTEPAGPERSSLYVLNSLTGKKNLFKPVGGGNLVKWYICGPTVYDSSHIGHASNYVRFDIVRRVLSDYFGYDVVVQMNVTDVDDKIIMRANERNLPFHAVARQYEKEFLDDMDALHVRPADHLTRVSEFVPEIVEYIKTIIANGFAYEQDGSVYFDTDAFVDAGYNYGKLEPSSVGNGELLAEGEGKLTAYDESVKLAKKSPNDFVLWKRSKPNEPLWESPWGPGRPGWHIECSAMAAHTLGPEIDIHAGGVDLRFPHHSNEIAQAEAYHKCDQWVNYFLHSGHLHIDGRKMSKSLKNFTTIRECLKRFNARQIRLLFLGHRYDAPMHYSESIMQESVNLDRSFIDFFGNLKAALREVSKLDPSETSKKQGEVEMALLSELAFRQKTIHEALCDNLDTQTALGEIVRLIRTINAYVASTQIASAETLLSVGRYITKMFRVFGLVDNEGQEIGYEMDQEGVQSREAVIAPILDAFVGFRDSARRIGRKEKSETSSELLKLCDTVRDFVLPPLGVRLEDRCEDQNTKWILEDSQSLMKELERKRQEEAAKRAEKEKLKAERVAKELEELRKGEVAPLDMFQSGEYSGLYSAYDERGMPTADAEGNPLSKSARKNLEKARTRQDKLHQRFLEAKAKGNLAPV